MIKENYVTLYWEEPHLRAWEKRNCRLCKKSVQNTGVLECELQCEIGNMVIAEQPARKAIINRAGLEDGDVCRELETVDGSLIPGTNAYYKQRKEDMAKLEAWVKCVG